jgi:hypothetical protein
MSSIRRFFLLLANDGLDDLGHRRRYRFGSLADILPVDCDFRFTPESGHCATHSITSSASHFAPICQAFFILWCARKRAKIKVTVGQF